MRRGGGWRSTALRYAAPGIAWRSRGGRRAIGGHAPIAILLATIALLCQAFLVETHVHGFAAAGRPGSIAVTGGAPLAVHDRRDAPADPATCPLCGALAVAAGLPAHAGATPAAPEPSSIWLAALPLAAWRRQHRSHAWRSRAPPPGLPPRR